MNAELLFRFALFAVFLVLLIFKPTTLNGQDWTVTSAPQEGWRSVACSADGNTLVAVAYDGPVVVSTNSGTTWTAGTLSGFPSAWRTNWTCVACSADGTKMVATTTTLIYRSTNTGISWSPTTAPSTNWGCIASSADGTTLLAGVGWPGGDIYISTNSGTSWIPTNPSPQSSNVWYTITCSADAAVVVAPSYYHAVNDLKYDGFIYVSTNHGTTWSIAEGLRENWISAAASADGKRLFAVAKCRPGGSPVTYVIPRPVYVSSDYGASWSAAPALQAWESAACSADGAQVVALGTYLDNSGLPLGCAIYMSSDGGDSWDLRFEPGCRLGPGPQAAATSADGARIIWAMREEGQILIGTKAVVPPRLNLTLVQERPVLSWLTPSTPFLLQQTPSLAQPDWTDVATQPTLNYTNLNQEVNLPTPTSPMFYRLVSQ